MLWRFDSFHSDIERGRIFGSRILPPPLKHLDCFRLSFCPMWRTEKLKAEFALNVQNPVCANELRVGGKLKETLKNARLRLVFC